MIRGLQRRCADRRRLDAWARSSGLCGQPPTVKAEAVAGEELERAGAVRERFAPARPPAVLFLGSHLAKRAVVAIGQKDRVVAEAEISAGRRDQRPVDAADVSLGPATRQSEAQGRNEMSAPLLRGDGAELLKAVLDLLHRQRKIFRRPGPARRKNAGRAAKRVHGEAGIVGERRQAGRLGGGAGLQFGILFERRAGLLRLGQTERGRGSYFESE